MENENQSLVPSPDEVIQMRNLTGETQTAMDGGGVPFISLHGQTGKDISGHFLKSTGKDEKGKTQYEDLGASIQGVIIRVRKSCQTKMDAKRSLYTYEFDNKNEELELFERGSKQPIDKGNYYQLSASYPELKFGQVLYLFLSTEEKVYKLGVGGGSLNNLWTYLKVFSDKKETVLRYITNFSSQEAMNPQNFPYMQMTFATAGETPDWQKIWNELKMLNSMISSTAYKKADILPANENAPVLDEAQPPVPVEDVVGQEQEQAQEGEINIENIPF